MPCPSAAWRGPQQRRWPRQPQPVLDRAQRHGGAPDEELAAAIDRDLGGFDAFKDAFSKAAQTRFGSGWAWLTSDRDGRLQVESSANQDSPLMGAAVGLSGNTPILALDVWEHAYYLHYQNRRPDYIGAFFNIINWAEVGRRYRQARAS
jgi:Fe-Mn family superoxide dismutase